LHCHQYITDLQLTSVINIIIKVMLLQKMLKSNKFTVNFNCEFKPVVNPRLKHKN